MIMALLKTIHVIVSFILILIVLLQTGKRADLAGAFGGGGSQTAFGTRGAATFLSKMTTTAAIIFMLTSLGLAIISKRGTEGESVLDQIPIEQEQSSPSFPTIPAPSGSDSTSSGKQEKAIEAGKELPAPSEESAEEKETP